MAPNRGDNGLRRTAVFGETSTDPEPIPKRRFGKTGRVLPTLLIDAEKEHYFKIKENSGRVHEILEKNGVPTEYHVLKGIGHYAVCSGQPLDDVMKLEIARFDKYLKGKK